MAALAAVSPVSRSTTRTPEAARSGSTSSVTRARDPLLGRWLERLDRGAVRAELHRLAARILELRAGVGRDEVAALDPLESMPFEELCVLCFQQSSGDSACPEVDIPAPFLAHRLLDRDIRDLKPTTR